MIRALLFVALAAALIGFAFWVYLRVELPVPAARRLAGVRAAVMVLVLLLLFDPRLPGSGTGDTGQPWVLLDASLSMSAVQPDGTSTWDAARSRADALASDGRRIVAFGGGDIEIEAPNAPDRLDSELAPALRLAAEAGVREVTVVSDMRFDDVVAVRSALAALPIEVTFEAVGADVSNWGLGRLDVSDVRRPTDPPIAEIELFGGAGDSIEVVLLEEGQEVAREWVSGASGGRVTTASIELPPAQASGRVRYTARLADVDDGFAEDGEATAYASIGHEEGGLVLLSLIPDWEPRYLLPVLEEVTGLSGSGFLRAGNDRWVTMGVATDRSGPVDSSTVATAASSAALLVVHGVSAEVDSWVSRLLDAPGRHLVFPTDRAGGEAVGLDVTDVQEGEWYASPDVPISPIAGALAGVELQGLPPLDNVHLLRSEANGAPLNVQRSGAGAPAPVLTLEDHERGRRVAALADGFWRWAARDEGRAQYRQLWSGVAGWLLADQAVTTAEPRPLDRVVARGTPVRWGLGGVQNALRIVVEQGSTTVLDSTVVGPGPISTGVLPPGEYSYTTVEEGDTVSTGRFDVAVTTDEMLPNPAVFPAPDDAVVPLRAEAALGTPLRTTPWPYLLILILLCIEWIVRRRTGLR